MAAASRVVAALPTVVGALLLAACASVGGHGVPGGPGTIPARTAAAPPSAPPATAHGITTGEQVCALVSVARAAAALGTSPAVSRQRSAAFLAGEPLCGYASADGRVEVTVLWGDARHEPFQPPQPALGRAPTAPLHGLGHPAAASATEVDVRIGDRTLVVESLGDLDVPRDRLVELARRCIEADPAHR